MAALLCGLQHHGAPGAAPTEDHLARPLARQHRGAARGARQPGRAVQGAGARALPPGAARGARAHAGRLRVARAQPGLLQRIEGASRCQALRFSGCVVRDSVTYLSGCVLSLLAIQLLIYPPRALCWRFVGSIPRARSATLQLGRHDVLGRCDERRGRAYGRFGSS